jgi:hypothetical protein
MAGLCFVFVQSIIGILSQWSIGTTQKPNVISLYVGSGSKYLEPEPDPECIPVQVSVLLAKPKNSGSFEKKIILCKNPEISGSVYNRPVLLPFDFSKAQNCKSTEANPRVIIPIYRYTSDVNNSS